MRSEIVRFLQENLPNLYYKPQNLKGCIEESWTAPETIVPEKSEAMPTVSFHPWRSCAN